MRRTKIVCTVGPACDSEDLLAKLVTAGMNVARVNFSHGTHDYHRMVIRRIKKIRKELGKPIGILQDLQGPKIRIGRIDNGPIQLQPGQPFVLTGAQVPGTAEQVSVSLASLPEEVAVGHPILLADGNIELVVESVLPPEIHCRVIVGGPLSSHKGINLPVSTVHVDSMTDKDRRDVIVGVEEGVDAVALSFVRTSTDVLAARKAVRDAGGAVPIIAKIEKHEGVTNIDRILEVADGVMVARGDLGVEIELERVPLVQKTLIRKCNQAGKPVITATQMLARMVDSPRPTRAEVTDVANAILDGTDAVMLSDETAAGRYPVEAVLTMDRIARTAEPVLDEKKFQGIDIVQGNTADSITRSSYWIATETSAAAIITPTWSGSTARLVSRFRPKSLIIAPTPNESSYDFLAFTWGVLPIRIPNADTFEDVIRFSIQAAREAGYVQTGDSVVFTGGAPLKMAGKTNFIKIERVD